MLTKNEGKVRKTRTILDSIHAPRWNVYLLNRGEVPLLYFESCSINWVKKRAQEALEKALDGSDADGFLVMRDDYPVPDTPWPGKRG